MHYSKLSSNIVKSSANQNLFSIDCQETKEFSYLNEALLAIGQWVQQDFNAGNGIFQTDYSLIDIQSSIESDPLLKKHSIKIVNYS